MRGVLISLGGFLVALIVGGLATGAVRRHAHRRDAAARLTRSSKSLEVQAAAARSAYPHCEHGAFRVGQALACESVGLKMAAGAFADDCLACLPDGEPQSTCESVEMAIVAGTAYADPCVR